MDERTKLNEPPMITPIMPHWRPQVDALLQEEWGGPIIISCGEEIDTRTLPGFLSVDDDGALAGIITFHIANTACEIVTLNSFHEDRGTGSKLVEATVSAARLAGCEKIWLITTNDNIRAIKFYQRRGFTLSAVRLHAVDEARKVKPQIPLIGMHGIPLQHELVFTRLL